MNWFKKRWLSVVRLARARKKKHKNIKIKNIVHIAFILCYNSSWLNLHVCLSFIECFWYYTPWVDTLLNVSDTILPGLTHYWMFLILYFLGWHIIECFWYYTSWVDTLLNVSDTILPGLTHYWMFLILYFLGWHIIECFWYYTSWVDTLLNVSDTILPGLTHNQNHLHKCTK